MIVCYEPSTGAWQFQSTYYCALPANNQEGFCKISPSHISMAWFLTVLLLLVPTCRTNSRPACCLGEIIDFVLRNAWRPGNTDGCDHPKKGTLQLIEVHLFQDTEDALSMGNCWNIDMVTCSDFFQLFFSQLVALHLDRNSIGQDDACCFVSILNVICLLFGPSTSMLLPRTIICANQEGPTDMPKTSKPPAIQNPIRLPQLTTLQKPSHNMDVGVY